MALQGAETASVKIGTISCPTGISAVSDGKSPMPTITITATSALTKTGSFTIPVIVNEGTVNEVTINKVFSYSIALKEIKEFKVQVLKSRLNQFNMSVRQVEQQYQLVDGKILFHQLAQETTYGQKTTVTYSDGTSTVSYSVARQGANGSSPTVSKNSY